MRRLAPMAIAIAAIAWLASGLLAADSLPGRLSDDEFWRLIEGFSEPNGTFRSENLLSNELQYQRVLPALASAAGPGRAYVGVGPEQNFTYIAALKPAVAFIVDIRRANLDLHLLYKALFEIAADRAEFVSRLFSRPMPPSAGAAASAREIFEALGAQSPNERLYLETLAAVRNQLYTKHGFEIPEEDLRGIEYVFRAYFMLGPAIRYSPMGLTGGTVQPTYAQLMSATDDRGRAGAFLATEEAFRVVKDLESRNLVVPLVGNFAGGKTIRAVASYLTQKGTTVSAFYLSNVEEYLRPEGNWQAFCANAGSLPHDGASLFIRSSRSPTGDPADGLLTEVGPLSAIATCR